MRHYYTADEIREAEAPLLASLPEGGLMRRAAFGLATAIVSELAQLTGGISGRRVCAVVGSGDNGGDALWAATFLRRRGVAAAAVLLNPERTHKAALAAFTRAGGTVMESVPAATDLVIDGVVGISGSGPLRAGAAEVFAAVDKAGIPVVAVDIPSGIDVQTGAADGPRVHATLTVTFGGLKPVHALGDCGRVKLVDIGLDLPPTDMLGFDAADVAARWPKPGPKDDKYTQGVTGVLAGSATYPGAAVPPPAWSDTREARARKCFRIGPKSSPRRAPARLVACRPGRSGRDSAPTRPRPRRCRSRSRRICRRSSTPTH
jgi:ADP-dependent NAD(P)H-hydrate dehydratase / NAD(P)H-hydrate epimerase